MTIFGKPNVTILYVTMILRLFRMSFFSCSVGRQMEGFFEEFSHLSCEPFEPYEPHEPSVTVDPKNDGLYDYWQCFDDAWLKTSEQLPPDQQEKQDDPQETTPQEGGLLLLPLEEPEPPTPCTPPNTPCQKSLKSPKSSKSPPVRQSRRTGKTRSPRRKPVSPALKATYEKKFDWSEDLPTWKALMIFAGDAPINTKWRVFRDRHYKPICIHPYWTTGAPTPRKDHYNYEYTLEEAFPEAVRLQALATLETPEAPAH